MLFVISWPIALIIDFPSLLGILILLLEPHKLLLDPFIFALELLMLIIEGGVLNFQLSLLVEDLACDVRLQIGELVVLGGAVAGVMGAVLRAIARNSCEVYPTDWAVPV